MLMERLNRIGKSISNPSRWSPPDHEGPPLSPWTILEDLLRNVFGAFLRTRFSASRRLRQFSYEATAVERAEAFTIASPMLKTSIVRIRCSTIYLELDITRFARS